MKSVEKALAHLMTLGAKALVKQAIDFRTQLASTEWRLGVCLLAFQRKRACRSLGFSDVYQLGEKGLNLSRKRTWELLSGVQALEHLPLMSEALKSGKLCWSKVRALKGIVTPETEAVWVEYALHHTTDEIRRTVTFTPKEWKRFQALNSSIEGKPIATEEQVEKVLQGRLDDSEEWEQKTGELEGPPSETARQTAPSTTRPSKVSPAGKTGLPKVKKKIRLVFELEAEDFPLYERAENRVRARLGKRVSRNVIFKEFVDSYLSHGSARSRARHQIVVHTDSEMKHGWYNTERGFVPVPPEVFQAARKEREPLHLDKLTQQPAASFSSGQAGLTSPPDFLGPNPSPSYQNLKRCKNPHQTDNERLPSDQFRSQLKMSRYVPTETVRKLLALADHTCQECDTRCGPFHIHHQDPISEGGSHELSRLKLLCTPCHGKEHEEDFETKPSWRAARRRKKEPVENLGHTRCSARSEH